MSGSSDGLSAIDLRSSIIKKTIQDTGLANTSIFQTNDQPTTIEQFPNDQFDISANSLISDKMTRALQVNQDLRGADGLEINFANESSGPQTIKKDYDPVAAPEGERKSEIPEAMTELAINKALGDAGLKVPPINLKGMMDSNASQSNIVSNKSTKASNINFNA